MNKHIKHLVNATVASVALAGTASASWVVDFSTYSVGDSLATYAGWSESEASDLDAPLSWAGSLNGGNSGAIGAYYNVPVGSTYSVSYTGEATVIGGTTVSVDLAISDYTDYAFRDQFSFSVLSDTGDSLATVFFTPLPASAAGTDLYGWNMTYSIGGSAEVDTYLKLSAGSLYGLSLTFGTDEFGLSVSGGASTYSFTDGASGYDASGLIGGVSFGMSSLPQNGDFGDGFLSFNNISVTVSAIPEPSSAAALAAMAALGLVATRRRRA
jgi:hypothetical protein